MKKASVIGLTTTGGLASVSGLAVLGGPPLVVLGVVVFALTVSLCWIVADLNRTKHLAMLIRAARGSQQRPSRQQVSHPRAADRPCKEIAK
jgi:hypothetical protein